MAGGSTGHIYEQSGSYGRYKIMTDQEIIDLFDSNLNITLRELSNLSGRTIANLKRLLMGE